MFGRIYDTVVSLLFDKITLPAGAAWLLFTTEEKGNLV